MRVTVTWLLLILLAVGGFGGTYALSEAFRADAREAWEAEASRAAQWLSSTILGWLEESYAPLSGLAILFENSDEVTEVEFLGATDALEARATSFFIDSKAAARPRTDGDGWRIQFTNDPLGPLSPETPLMKAPQVLETIRLAVERPDQVILGAPFSSEDGTRYSPAALAVRDARGPLVVIGLVNYDAIVKGLFEIHQLDGLQLYIRGRFQGMDGPGPQLEVVGNPLPGALYAVTTRTVSAGADLTITWYVERQFSKGPRQALANITLAGGIAGVLLLVSFIGVLFLRNRTIAKKIVEATGELTKVSEAVTQSPVSVVITDKNGNIEYVNPRFSEVTGYGADEVIGHNPRILKTGDLPDSFYKNLWDTILRGETWRGEMVNRKKNGEEFWETVSISPIKSAAGAITHFVAVKEDITEQKQIQEVLHESEARFRGYFENSQVAMAVISPEKGWIEVNDPLQEMLGYRREALHQMDWDQLTHPDDLEADLKNFHLMQAGEIDNYTQDKRFIRKDGEIVYTTLSVSCVRNENGTIHNMLVSVLDITDRKQAEQVLQERAAQLRTIFQNSPVGILHFGKDGTVLDCNDRHAELMGSTREKIMGMNLLAEVKNAELQKAISGALAGKQTVFEGLYTSVSGGRTVAVRSIFNPTEPGTSTTAVINTTEDITERKKMEDELQARISELDQAQSAMLNMMEDLDEEKARAEAATRAKSDFLANMSHEIRTPMNAVIGMAHLALKTELTPKQRDYLDKIQSSANSLLGIINDILDFSKIEAGKLDMEAVEFDLSKTLDNVANVITVKAQEKENLEVLFYLDSEVPSFLVGDPLRLNQILVNLGNNAVKFTRQGEIVLTTKILKTSGDRVTLQFSVRDTGIGLTAEQQGKLFQAFSQADTSTTRKFGGTGLGLTISKRLVNMMGGEIWAESEPEQGTTFYFTADFGLGKETVKKRFMPAPDIKGLKVLVVDDNATSRQIFHDILESFSFEVFLAASGEEALEEVTRADPERPFELVIMDWKMPGMDGIEASRRIKSHPGLSKIPAIILATAYGREGLMRQADEIGLEGFLLKPVSPSMLFDAIMQGLGIEVQAPSRVGRGTENESEALNAIVGARVLLAEDNEINQQVAKEILEGAGLVVTIANDGQEAIDRLQSAQFEAVLMDIQMPVMDGYAAARAIRNSKSGIRNIPIIAMTAHAMAGDADKSRQAGMNGHVTKPIDPTELFSALQKWIKPSAKRAQVRQPEMVAEGPDSDKAGPKAATLPESLPGFNLAAGLKRLRGNQRLYRKLLLDFGVNYGGVCDEIRKALKAEDFKLAHSLIHNIKGLSGNLDATDLQLAAVELERLVKGDHRQTSFQKQLDQKFIEFEKAANQALEAVRTLGGSAPAEEKVVASSVDRLAEVPADQLKALADRIEAAVELGDVMKIKSIAAAAKSQSDVLAPLCDELIRSAEDFDFDGIQEIIKRYITTAGI
jgi:PAS domain S-box-containing protein